MDTSENTATLLHAVPGEWAERAHANAATYKDMYGFSVSDPDSFWEYHGKRIDWIKPFTRVKNTCFDPGKCLDKMVRGWHHECGVELHRPASSVPLLTDDSQIGADLRVCADEKDRTDIDQQR